ncbi:MAG: trigger factor, partial [Chloroflexota bacterium]
MTLQIEQKETDNRELKLTVQVEEKRVQDAIRSTARKLAKNLRIPGFRPGKAPFHVVERTVGKQALRVQAIDEITQDLYQEAIAQVGAIPYAPGSLDDMKLEPLVLDLTIPLTPTVDLGEYRLVREEPVEVSVEDKAVDEALARIQEKHALIEPADRPAAEGDLIIADVKGTQDGETMIDQEGAEMILDPEKLYPDTDFVKNVVGLSAGEQVSFDLNTSEED